jgi:DNA-directed RNA polymerase specialized sigma24 family protein
MSTMTKPYTTQWAECSQCGQYWYQWDEVLHKTDSQPLRDVKKICPECEAKMAPVRSTADEAKEKSQIRRRLTEAERMEIQKKLGMGQRIVDIAKELNLPEPTVQYYKKAAQEISPETKSDIIDQAVSGVSQGDIAENFGIAPRVIGRVIREWRKRQSAPRPLRKSVIIPEISPEQQQIDTLQTVINERDSRIAELEKELTILKEEISRYEGRIGELSLRLEMEEENHAADVVSYHRTNKEIISEMSLGDIVGVIKEMMK